jgi:hypothetical protein
MAYKNLTRRSYKIINITIWLLPVVNSSTCKSWNITKHDHHIHHIYHIHQILWLYHITNTPCKNKLDASNLLIACFTWLMGATHKNDSYLLKAIMVILVLPKTCCKSDDNYSERNWHPQCSRSRKHSRVRLAWAASILLCHDIKKYTKRNLQQKHQCLQEACCVLLLNTSTHRSGSDTTEGFCSIVNQKNSYGCEQESQDLI